MMLAMVLAGALGQGTTVEVATLAALRDALAKAKPGVTIAIAPGTYEAALFASDLHGEPGRPIRIVAADPTRPPVFRSGRGLHFSKVSHLEIADIHVDGASGNGLNIDDGGDRMRPSQEIVLSRLEVRNIPPGNHDGIKLSGVAGFRIEKCSIFRWGGSGVDMVGCRKGRIKSCVFSDGGANGIQAKGGSSDIVVEFSTFADAGLRGVNLGGSTGLEFFRPPLISGKPSFEAKDLTVRGCTFLGGGAAAAFVGVDGARFEFNTIVHPGRWAFRILQETREPGFVASRNGVLERNLIVFRFANWSEGGVNIGPDTEPASFRFLRNFWYAEDRPQASRPRLPTEEVEGRYGEDPRIQVFLRGQVAVPDDSPARDVGAHAWKKRSSLK